MSNPTFRALCAELVAAADLLCGSGYSPRQPVTRLILTAHVEALEDCAALAQPEPVGPTDEELIGPIMWMIDECVYDNDKGEIAESLRELIARWGAPANTIREGD